MISQTSIGAKYLPLTTVIVGFQAVSLTLYIIIQIIFVLLMEAIYEMELNLREFYGKRVDTE